MSFEFITRIPDRLKGLFIRDPDTIDSNQTPVVAAEGELDSLLLRALQIAEHPTVETDSPLTTPPDTPPQTPPGSPLLASAAAPNPSTQPLPNADSSQSLFSQDPTLWSPSTNQLPPEDHSRDKLRSKQNRQIKRSLKSIALCQDVKAIQSHQPDPKLITQAQPLEPQFEDQHLPHGASGYLGVERDLPPRREYSYDELVGPKFRFRVHRHNPHDTCPLLHSQSASVIGLIVPGPRHDSTWSQNVREMNSAIERLRAHCTFKKPRLTVRQRRLARMGLGGPHVLDPRRGRFDHLSFGISFGNGQKMPRVMAQDPKNTAVLEEIRSMKAFQRLAGFISVVFLTWAPKLFLYYAEITASLLARYPNLHLPFQRCIFAAFTVNFGPTTVCYPHRDIKNLAFGWCAITALGDYDWTKGGHLVLWDLKLIIEFPPGTTIFIPSALVCHLNTKVSPHERRYSFAMYSAGGLFRWVEHGYQAEQNYKKTVSAARVAADGSKRWASGFAMFSTMEELQLHTRRTVS
ncbi:hypothetical protein VNI00_006294 [Paramarasmius palmivorus]|uniref:Uncharacterized protein n=1 Tax=Paramarasmius palmivorus TaxID=297713 RepID=A0AAW0DA33_9AGAR